MDEAPSTLGEFVSVVARHPNSKLVFVDNGIEIKPNYHVTELKSAVVRAIDCGRRQSEWSEALVQLLDGPMSATGTHMRASKFVAIVQAGLEAIPELSDAELYIEYAPNNEAMKKLTVLGIDVAGDRLVVAIGGVAAACKQIERYLEPARDSGVPDTTEPCCRPASSPCC